MISVEVWAPEVDPIVLDRLVHQTVPDCLTSPSRRASGQPCLRTIQPDSPDEHGTIVAPLDVRHDQTIFAPLGAPYDKTIPGRLVPRHDETIPGRLLPRHDETLPGRLLPRHDQTLPGELIPSPPTDSQDLALQDLTSGLPEASDQRQASVQAAPRRDWHKLALRVRYRAAETLQVAAILIAILLGIRASVQTFRVDGPSMSPNFETGQSLIVNRLAYWHIDGTPFEGLLPVKPQGSIDFLFGGPRRGDVVVLRPPTESRFQADLIKRVIGLPGDAVSIQDGQLFVNGNLLVEPYVQFPADYTFPDRDIAIEVPDSSYFVLGDNRPVSADSHLGWFVPMQNIVGQAWLMYWPVTRWGFVPHGDLREVAPDELPTEIPAATTNTD